MSSTLRPVMPSTLIFGQKKPSSEQASSGLTPESATEEARKNLQDRYDAYIQSEKDKQAREEKANRKAMVSLRDESLTAEALLKLLYALGSKHASGKRHGLLRRKSKTPVPFSENELWKHFPWNVQEQKYYQRMDSVQRELDQAMLNLNKLGAFSYQQPHFFAWKDEPLMVISQEQLQRIEAVLQAPGTNPEKPSSKPTKGKRTPARESIPSNQPTPKGDATKDAPSEKSSKQAQSGSDKTSSQKAEADKDT